MEWPLSRNGVTPMAPKDTGGIFYKQLSKLSKL
jgi:hypothetical protein